LSLPSVRDSGSLEAGVFAFLTSSTVMLLPLVWDHPLRTTEEQVKDGITKEAFTYDCRITKGSEIENSSIQLKGLQGPGR
jgi:hypothetical protein